MGGAVWIAILSALRQHVDPGLPARELTSTLTKNANEKGLILLSRGAYGNVIRFLAPLTASDALVKEGMDIFAASLAEAVNRVAL